MTLAVSIPTVEPGSPSLYQVIVSIGPEQSYEVKHRFSDFLKLAADAEAELGEPVPVPPPPKPSAWQSAWSASRNPQLLEQRRIALESMLRALLRAPDFASSLALNRFLELAKHKRGVQQSSSVTTADWVAANAQISRLVSEARAQPVPRGPAARHKIVHAKLMVGQLQRQLESFIGGVGEKQRRQQQLDGWIVTLHTLEASLVPTTISLAGDSAAGRANAALELFQGRSLGSGPNGVTGSRSELEETEETRKHNNAGLLQTQRERMASQDAEVDALRAAIGRQKELGLAINAELEKQNQLLDELDDDVHRVNARLNQARRDTAKLR